MVSSPGTPLTEVTSVLNVPRGIAYITVQQIATYVTSFIYYVLLVRILNLTQIGQVSILAAAMSIFTTLTQLALPTAATRFISASMGNRDPSNASAVATTTRRLLVAIAGPTLLVAFLASPWLGQTVFRSSDATLALAVTFAASFLLDLTALYGGYFLGLGLYAKLVYQNILFVPLSRGLGLMLAFRGLGPLGIAVGWAIGALATLFLSLYFWKGRLPQPSKFSARPLIIFSLPIFASGVISLLQSWGDIAFLQGVLGQFGTTGAFYLVVTSVGFLSVLWAPAASALLPSLSSSYASDGHHGVSAKLGVAIRLVNTVVLPAGTSLAAIAPTALGAIYGPSLVSQAVPFAILALTVIFAAQSLLLLTSLQAIGKTKPILGISLAATIIDLAVVGLGARALGTTAGALGRAFLALVMTVLAWQSLRGALRVPITSGLSKALALALLTAGPLAAADYLLTIETHVSALVRLPLLLATFAACYLAASRAIIVFTEDDFDLLENALPRFLGKPLRVLERIVTTNRTVKSKILT
jgi:O-antigen/teichoic acid export membrane protein